MVSDILLDCIEEIDPAVTQSANVCMCVYIHTHIRTYIPTHIDLFPKQRSIGVLNLCKERDSVTRLTGD